jgi:hypothetical protein
VAFVYLAFVILTLFRLVELTRRHGQISDATVPVLIAGLAGFAIWVVHRSRVQPHDVVAAAHSPAASGLPDDASFPPDVARAMFRQAMLRRHSKPRPTPDPTADPGPGRTILVETGHGRPMLGLILEVDSARRTLFVKLATGQHVHIDRSNLRRRADGAVYLFVAADDLAKSADVSPSDPRLLQWSDFGLTDCCLECRASGDPSAEKKPLLRVARTLEPGWTATAEVCCRHGVVAHLDAEAWLEAEARWGARRTKS